MGVSNIVILTGAGISAESGLKTFRGPDGLWEGHRVEDVATPEAFERDPMLVQQFYDARRARLGEVAPNAAHDALARLDAEWPGELLIVTQNVDDLHERAGAGRLLHMHGELNSALCAACASRVEWRGDLLRVTQNVDDLHERAGARRLLHMHGELTSGWCLACGSRFAWTGAMADGTSNQCPRCGLFGQVRPDIVWFGEMPYEMERIDEALQRCDLFVSIGTSGAVYPAAGFVQTARYCGAHTLEINLEPSQGSIIFDERRYGPAGVEVPKWVDEVLG